MALTGGIAQVNHVVRSPVRAARVKSRDLLNDRGNAEDTSINELSHCEHRNDAGERPPEVEIVAEAAECFCSRNGAVSPRLGTSGNYCRGGVAGRAGTSARLTHGRAGELATENRISTVRNDQRALQRLVPTGWSRGPIRSGSSQNIHGHTFNLGIRSDPQSGRHDETSY